MELNAGCLLKSFLLLSNIPTMYIFDFLIILLCFYLKFQVESYSNHERGASALLFAPHCRKKIGDLLIVSQQHMCLVSPPNPYKLEQSWELTFLIGLTLLSTKLASKKILTDVL